MAQNFRYLANPLGKASEWTEGTISFFPRGGSTGLQPLIRKIACSILQDPALPTKFAITRVTSLKREALTTFLS
jgi:hypothetical protein